MMKKIHSCFLSLFCKYFIVAA